MENLRVIGAENISSVKLILPFEKRADFGIPRFFSNLIYRKPVLLKSRCKGCGVCALKCPAEAISIVKGYPVFDYKRCIKCYCCHELCMYEAIELKR